MASKKKRFSECRYQKKLVTALLSSSYILPDSLIKIPGTEGLVNLEYRSCSTFDQERINY